MYKVNLIRGWKSTETHRQYRNRIILALSIFTGLLLLAYLGLFAYFLVLQKQLSTLANKQYVSKSGYEYSTEELTKALYGLKKLDEIKNIYLDYPEYALYHRFLLDKVFNYDSFVIENYALSRDHRVDMALTTQKLDDIYSLIALLESPEVSQYFSDLEITSISSAKDKNQITTFFKTQVKLKFNNKLLDEKT